MKNIFKYSLFAAMLLYSNLYAANLQKYIWDGVNWVADGGGGGNGTVISFNDFNNSVKTVPGSAGQIVSVLNNGALEQWVDMNGDGVWKQISSKETFTGTSTASGLVCSLSQKAGGSTATVDLSTWGYGTKTFTKTEVYGSGGYWKTTDNLFFMASNIDDLASSPMTTSGQGFIDSGDSKCNVMWISKDNVSLGFYYNAKDWKDVVQNFTKVRKDLRIKTANDNAFWYRYDNSFDTTKTYFQTTDNKNLITNGGRDSFNMPTNALSGSTFYTYINDCTSSTCNGNAATNYFAGNVAANNLYPFYYSTSGNRNNQLIDAIPYANITEAYNASSKSAGLLPDGTVILYKQDPSNNYAWLRSTDKFAAIKSTNTFVESLPKAITADVAAFSGSYLKISSFSDLKGWYPNTSTGISSVNLNDGTHNVNLGHCSSTDYWSDNCSNFTTATTYAQLSPSGVGSSVIGNDNRYYRNCSNLTGYSYNSGNIQCEKTPYCNYPASWNGTKCRTTNTNPYNPGTYSCPVDYSCPSGGSRSETTCYTSSTYTATATANTSISSCYVWITQYDSNCNKTATSYQMYEDKCLNHAQWSVYNNFDYQMAGYTCTGAGSMPVPGCGSATMFGYMCSKTVSTGTYTYSCPSGGTNPGNSSTCTISGQYTATAVAGTCYNPCTTGDTGSWPTCTHTTYSDANGLCESGASLSSTICQWNAGSQKSCTDTNMFYSATYDKCSKTY